MDMRFYHDGLGMETHAQELEGLEMTYEDYEKGYGTPQGVARSSEITLWALAATPTRERLVQMAAAVQTPPQIVATPAHYLASGVFGSLWSLPDRSHPMKAAIEDRLDFLFDFYKKEVEQRHWYGFWDYGDIRHTYDADRHEWRYDVGGFAWDNSELSPDLWLWYSFLRTGRADIFRFAEAMVRHTSEVDTYHLGRFAGLGTRHNVQHWGCSAKQARISTAAYRRFYYFMTADERIGDIMQSLLDVDRQLDAVDPVRKLARQPPKGPYPARLSFGTDWASLAANWLTEWERSGKPQYRDKILRGMTDIGNMPHGFFSAERAGYDPATGRLYNIAGDKAEASHLKRSVRRGGDLCRADRAGPGAGLREGLAAVLRALQRAQGRAGPRAGHAAWRHQCAARGPFAPDRLCRLEEARSGPGTARLARVPDRRPIRQPAAAHPEDSGPGRAQSGGRGALDQHQQHGPVGPGRDPEPGLDWRAPAGGDSALRGGPRL